MLTHVARQTRLLIVSTAILLTLIFVPHASAQEGDPENGHLIFELRCANCHGPTGLGDGELAVNLPNPPTAIGDPAYLAANDPNAIFELIKNGRIERGMPLFGEGNSDPLTDAEIWDIVATLGTLNPIIANAQISGTIINGTTGDLIETGDVTLLQFDSFEITDELTQSLDSNASYQFGLEEVSPLDAFTLRVEHEGLSFASNIARLSADSANINLPVTVYDQSSDSSGIIISRLNIVVEYLTDSVRVNELYVFRNEGDTVYTGETADWQNGTLAITLPPNVPTDFQRTFSSELENFTSAMDSMIADGDTFLDTLPVRPGDGSAILLARYVLSYEQTADFSHVVNYPVENMTLILPETSAQFAPTSQWLPNGVETIGNDRLLNFTRNNHAAGDLLPLGIIGTPDRVQDQNGAVILVRDEQQELIIGGAGLALALLFVSLMISHWRAPQALPHKSTLLAKIAALDEAYEAKKLDARSYWRDREKLKEQLVEVWDETDS